MLQATETTHFHVAIAGTGFAGLGLAIRLQQQGLEDYVLFERADDVGGVWRDNTYPGAACDVQSHLYSFSFAPNPSWTRAYSPQGEIHAYLRGCAERFGVLPRVRFGHELLDASWCADEQLWRISTSKGDFTADVLVSAVGALSEPSTPHLPGLKSFAGKVMHSARWDHGDDLAGRRVAVIGTGASAIQFVPAIAPKVEHLALFQRTPPWILPRFDHPVSERTRALFAKAPFTQVLLRLWTYLLREVLVLGFRNPKLMRVAEWVARRHLKRQVSDPKLRAKLTPSYVLGCKRGLLSDDYLPALTRPNVNLVTSPIREVRERSIVTADGAEHEVDTLIFGTGFNVTALPIAKRVRGRDGRSLDAHWAGSPKAHLGTTVHGFPNFFMLQGPNTLLGHSSVIVMLEAQFEHVLEALHFMKRSGTSIEPTQAAQAASVANVDERMRGTVWTQGGCSSWYLDATGRNSTLWPGTTLSFKRQLSRFDPADYESPLPSRGEGQGEGESGRRSLVERLEAKLATLAMRLPQWTQRLLAGGRAVVRDGLTLHPELQLLLKLRALKRTPAMSALPPAESRLQVRRDALVHAGATVEVAEVHELLVADTLPSRLYVPPRDGDALLLYLHGGGFVLGDLDTHDAACRLLCLHAGVRVLSVGYRLAPEHPFPAGLDDACAAFEWARTYARELGVDPARIAIGGDSAGGNLAAAATQRLVRKGAGAPAAQLLLYPVVDRSVARASLERFAEGFLLTRADIDWFRRHYAGPVNDPEVSPLLQPSLQGLPPAIVVTAGFDPLRDEGEAYAEALRAAGSKASSVRFDSLIHGFLNLTGVSPACRAATIEVATHLRGALS